MKWVGVSSILISLGSFLAQLDKDEEDLKKFNSVSERGVEGNMQGGGGGGALS